jgi:hypothetical protein
MIAAPMPKQTSNYQTHQQVSISRMPVPQDKDLAMRHERTDDHENK